MKPASVLCYGEILWDLLPPGEALGGAPLNFAYRLQELGNQAYPVSRLGSDPLGVRAAEQMQALGLPLDFVQSTDELPTGTVPVTLDAKGIPQYHITPDVAYDHIGLSQELLDAARSVDCIYFGTLIQRGEGSRHTLHALLDAAPEHIVRVCDVNLRPDCYTTAIVLDSLRRAHVVKLSQDEVEPMAEMIGLEPSIGAEEFARKLLQLFTLRSCAVTRGAEGVFAVGDTGESVDFNGIAVEVVDTVGSGDAFLAGFMDAMLRGENLRESCRQGNILGALAAQRLGATGKIAAHEIRGMEHRLT